MRHSALLSLLKCKEDLENANQEEVPVHGVTLDTLVAAMADVGNNWERVPLRFTEGREGWEDALVGCLKDVGFRRYFSCLSLILTPHVLAR